MIFQKRLERLREYVESEEITCKRIEERLREKGHPEDFRDNWEQAVLNQRNTNIRILKDILQELETDDLKLQITFQASNAGDLPWLGRESFERDGIKLEGKGGTLQASVESMQSEFVVFWVSNTIGIIGGGITIADFIYQKIQNYKNAKMRVGTNKLDSTISKEKLRKIIQEELKRLKDDSE